MSLGSETQFELGTSLLPYPCISHVKFSYLCKSEARIALSRSGQELLKPHLQPLDGIKRSARGFALVRFVHHLARCKPSLLMFPVPVSNPVPVPMPTQPFGEGEKGNIPEADGWSDGTSPVLNYQPNQPSPTASPECWDWRPAWL